MGVSCSFFVVVGANGEVIGKLSEFLIVLWVLIINKYFIIIGILLMKIRNSSFHMIALNWFETETCHNSQQRGSCKYCINISSLSSYWVAMFKRSLSYVETCICHWKAYWSEILTNQQLTEIVCPPALKSIMPSDNPRLQWAANLAVLSAFLRNDAG